MCQQNPLCLCVKSGRAGPFKAASESEWGVSVSTLVYGPTGLATLWRIMVQQQQRTVAKPVGLERASVWVEAGWGRWNPTSSSLFNSIQGRKEVTHPLTAVTGCTSVWWFVFSPQNWNLPRVALACDGKVENQSDWRLFNQRSDLSNTRLSCKWPKSWFKKKKKGGKSQAVWGKPPLTHTHNGQPDNTLLHLWRADTWKICFHTGPKAGQPHPQPARASLCTASSRVEELEQCEAFVTPQPPPPTFF